MIGLDKWDVSRLEVGKTQLKLDVANRIADALGVSLSEVLAIEDGGRTTILPRAGSGMAEDLAPYDGGPNDPFMRLVEDNTYPLLVQTDALDLAGIRRGDVVIVDGSAAICERPPPLAAVRVQYHPDPNNPERAVTLLRQYVPPRLVITNSSVRNERSLDIDIDDAQILGVVRSSHRALSRLG